MKMILVSEKVLRAWLDVWFLMPGKKETLPAEHSWVAVIETGWTVLFCFYHFQRTTAIYVVK